MILSVRSLDRRSPSHCAESGAAPKHQIEREQLKGTSMSKHKYFAMFALGALFALTAALPTSALDREDRASKEPFHGQAAKGPLVSPGFKISGHGDLHRLRFHQMQNNHPNPNSIFEKAACSFPCGEDTITCSGSSVSCWEGENGVGGGCSASGGGSTLGMECYF